MKDILLYFSCLYEGDFFKIYKAISTLEQINPNDLIDFKKRISSSYFTILEDLYPSSLKESFNCPYILYYKGNINILSEEKKIAVIGSRLNSLEGEKRTRSIVKELVKNGYVIVSGLAKGIDAIAHDEALKNNGLTIAVLGGGLDNVYPKCNIDLFNRIVEKGLVISEYPDFVKPSANKFPLRNRLIAGLSDATLVCEAKIRSGSMITVAHTLEIGRDVFCIPSNDSDSGCNKLIEEGAIAVNSIKDILDNRY